LLFALCSLLFALCSLLFALCSLLFALCSLLIVDDHPFIFEAMRQALLAIGFEAAGETNDGIDALRMTESLMPRFGIMDIDL